ncbi:hypothetical protein PIB30_020347 [Stylosanthes scabra]|uniref:Uncharacterized protein n=1 Tax=Stylosanthes scabra TaxID=79078 RepID=A0ABU6Z6U5_9FABA|nr:hypothetical protein [Stylosanthes scabra]
MNATRVEGSRESECLKRNAVVRGKVLKTGSDRPVQQVGPQTGDLHGSIQLQKLEISKSSENRRTGQLDWTGTRPVFEKTSILGLKNLKKKYQDWGASNFPLSYLSQFPIPKSQDSNPSLASTSQLSIPVSQSTRVQCRRRCRCRSPSCSSTPSPLNYHAFVPDSNVDAASTPILPCLWFSKSPTLTPLNLQSTTVSVLQRLVAVTGF